MSTRIKYGENPFVGFNPVLKRLQERGFKGVIVPRMNVFPELPTLLQEKFHLKTQTSLRIGSRFELREWVYSQRPHLEIAPIWRWVVENREQ